MQLPHHDRLQHLQTIKQQASLDFLVKQYSNNATNILLIDPYNHLSQVKFTDYKGDNLPITRKSNFKDELKTIDTIHDTIVIVMGFEKMRLSFNLFDLKLVNKLNQLSRLLDENNNYAIVID